MNTLSLINRQGPCPPDGFRYVDPVDGFVAHAWSWNDWVPIQVSHLEANGREVPLDLAEQMEDQLCRTLPVGWCNYDDANRPRPTVALDWGAVTEGLKTFGKWIVGGCTLVSQTEANRRSEICSRCYLNVHIAGCAMCQKLVKETVGERKTSGDQNLKGCAVCKCVLKAKVWFPISSLDTETDSVQNLYPDFCWLNKGSDNYRG